MPSAGQFLVVVALTVLPGFTGYLFWRQLKAPLELRARQVVLLVFGGSCAAALSSVLERSLWALTDLSLVVAPGKEGAALLAMFLFAAPLEEGLKVLIVWPAYLMRRISSAHVGLAFAVFTAMGFTAAKTLYFLTTQDVTGLTVTRILLALPAQLFFAGLWGYSLGSHTRARWFSLVWFVSMLAHGLYDHIVFGRGPELLIGALPLLLVMGLLALAAFKDVAPESASALARSVPLLALAEPPSLREMRRALRRTDQPLMLHWIALGALVTIGVTISSLAFAIYLGHKVGLDFTAFEETNITSNGPLLLLGAALLAAFPLSGYMVAKASGTTSVLEPALGAALAFALLATLLSVTAPITLIFALAVAPIAFALACGGAWFGMGQH